MDTFKKMSKQQLMFGGIIALLLIIIIGLVVSRSGRDAANAGAKPTSTLEEPVEVIPTVDSSVEAEITGRRDATIEIKGIPAGTKNIEYEISYNTAAGGIEGAFGDIDVDGKSTVEEEIKFGTCSSGVCRYHEIDGPIKVTFKFNGDYGAKLLEKEFES